MEKYQYSNRQYEQAAVGGGMTPELWKKLFATRQAVEQMGRSFLQPCHDEQPYALFHRAEKVTTDIERKE